MTKPTQHNIEEAAEDVLTIQDADLDSREGQASVIEALQRLINSGAVWHLEGWIGRMAMEAINSGDCCLGPKGHFDAYGEYVPSRSEVMPGTPGSLSFISTSKANRGPVNFDSSGGNHRSDRQS